MKAPPLPAQLAKAFLCLGLLCACLGILTWLLASVGLLPSANRFLGELVSDDPLLLGLGLLLLLACVLGLSRSSAPALRNGMRNRMRDSTWNRDREAFRKLVEEADAGWRTRAPQRASPEPGPTDRVPARDSPPQ